MKSLKIFSKIRKMFPKLVSKKEVEEVVTVDYLEYIPAYIRPQSNGRNTIFVPVAAEYNVYFKFEDMSFYIDDEDTYNLCYDKEGQKMIGVFIKRVYDSGKSTYELEAVK